MRNEPEPTVVFDAVDKRTGFVSAWVRVDGIPHRVGHIRTQGWFCNCPNGRRCKAIKHAREQVVDVAKGAVV